MTMMKMIFSNKRVLFVLFFICLLELFLIVYLTQQNTAFKKKFVKQQKELNATLEKNELYEIYESRKERFASIPLKITDGLKKYILLTNLAYLKARMFKYNDQNKIDLYGYSVFLTILADSKYCLYIEPEEFKYIKENMPFYVPVEYYKTFVKKHENMTLKKFLNKFTTYVKDQGYSINRQNIKNPQTAMAVQIYLYYKYKIFIIWNNCWGSNNLAGKALEMLNEK